MRIVKLNSNREGWAAFRSALSVSRKVGVDIETCGQGDTQQGALQTHTGRIRLVQLACDTKTAYILDMFHATQDERDYLVNLACDHEYVKIAHNAKFEIAWFLDHLILGYADHYADAVRPERWVCTYLAGQILRAGDKTVACGLADTLERWLAVEVDKTEQKSDWWNPNLTDSQWEYAALDVLHLIPLWDVMSKALVDTDQARVALIEFDALPVVAEMEVRGFHLDRTKWMDLLSSNTTKRDKALVDLTGIFQPYVDWTVKNPDKPRKPTKVQYGCAKPIGKTASDAEKVAHDLCLREWERACAEWNAIPSEVTAPVNLNSPVKIRGILEKILECELRGTRENELSEHIADYARDINIGCKEIEGRLAAYAIGGATERQVEASKLIVAQLEWKKYVLDKLLDYRGFDKAVSSYGQNYINALDRFDRIHANFKQIEAETGRMSSGGGEDSINLQNVPRDEETRGCFTAPKGRKLLIADFSTIELRILAQMSKCDAFRRAFSLDLHKYSAMIFFGIPYEEITKDLRQKGKNCGFAMVYGAGPHRISQITGDTKEAAASSLSNYRGEFPGNATWLDSAQKQARFQGFARTMAGRLAKFDSKRLYAMQKRAEQDRDYRLVKELKGKLGAISRNGSNSPIQGTSADLTKRAMKLVYDRLRGLDAWIVNVVHDEIVVECAEEIASMVAQILKEEMERAGSEFLTVVTCPIDVHIADSWAEKG